MTEQQRQNLIKAANAVMNNKKKAMRMMRDGEARCCLCVMVDKLKLEESMAKEQMPVEREFVSAFGITTAQRFKIDGETAVLSIHNDGEKIGHFIKPKSHRKIGKALLEFAKNVKVDE